MNTSYKISGILSIKGIDYVLKGNLKFDIKGKIIRTTDEDSKVSILPGKYYIDANVYGEVLPKEKGLVLMLRFPQEYKIASCVSLNGSSFEDMSGDYSGLLKFFNVREYDLCKPFFHPETDFANVNLKLEKLVKND
ncbi:MAG: hypothetical protein ACP5N2_02625 [Candidatus Nanoarchaeia archaeon]